MRLLGGGDRAPLVDDSDDLRAVDHFRLERAAIERHNRGGHCVLYESRVVEQLYGGECGDAFQEHVGCFGEVAGAGEEHGLVTEYEVLHKCNEGRVLSVT